VNARTPLLLVPGLLCTAALWRHQIDGLADVADIGVADHTGHDDIRDLAAAILDRAPPRFALAGLSFGGYIAFEIMRQAAGRVTRLALLDTSARPDTPEQIRRRLDVIALVERGRFIGVSDALIRTFVHPDRVDDGRLMAAIRGMADDTGVEAFIRQEKAIMSRPDSRPDLGRIACPTLVLCGRQDALTPVAWHEEIAEGIAGSRLVVIDDCGHLTTMERPEETTAALRRWLSET